MKTVRIVSFGTMGYLMAFSVFLALAVKPTSALVKAARFTHTCREWVKGDRAALDSLHRVYPSMSCDMVEQVLWEGRTAAEWDGRCEQN